MTRSLFPFTNSGLLSANYLEHRLRESPQWTSDEAQMTAVLSGIRADLDSVRKENVGLGEESQLEELFIRPVLKKLGFVVCH